MPVENESLIRCDICGISFLQENFSDGQSTADTMICNMCMKWIKDMEEENQRRRSIAEEDMIY